MNPLAITKLRRTFMVIAMTSFLVVIAAMGTASSVATIATISGAASRTIDAIIDAKGDIPTESNFQGSPFHEEAIFGLRFFTVSFNKAGEITSVDLSHVALIDEDFAITLAYNFAESSEIAGLGRYENYIYKEGMLADGSSMIVFLDCAIQIANARETILFTMAIAAIAIAITFICVFFFSKRAIRLELENAQRQQRFMTNASHELKTPISVIRANTEITEMMSGETEWTQSTMRQVDRLDGLIRNLMTIVRGVEQSDSTEPHQNANVSDVVEQAVKTFRSVAQQNNIELSDTIAPDITLYCNPKSIEQLVYLLVDNALKYCDPNGKILVSFTPTRIGHSCTLVVANDYAAGSDVDYHRFFDRFYREDESHENQQGYGIGLSVAESICKHYHGSIKASWKAGTISFTCSLKNA